MLDDLYPQYFQVYIQRSKISYKEIKGEWIQNEAKRKRKNKYVSLIEEIVLLGETNVSYLGILLIFFFFASWIQIDPQIFINIKMDN